jgi:hypothetical protein
MNIVEYTIALTKSDSDKELTSIKNESDANSGSDKSLMGNNNDAPKKRGTALGVELESSETTNEMKDAGEGHSVTFDADNVINIELCESSHDNLSSSSEQKRTAVSRETSPSQLSLSSMASSGNVKIKPSLNTVAPMQMKRQLKEYAEHSVSQRERNSSFTGTPSRFKDGEKSCYRFTNDPQGMTEEFCCAPCARRKIGTFHVCCQTLDGEPLCLVGPCWPFATFITLPLLLGIPLVILFLILIPYNLSSTVTVLYCLVFAACFIAFCLTSFRNPGILERVPYISREAKEADPNGKYRKWAWNDNGQSMRPPGALFDHTLKCILEDYDHVCPWSGTGIGRNNMLSFKAFVCLVSALCWSSIGVVIYFLAMTPWLD